MAVSLGRMNGHSSTVSRYLFRARVVVSSQKHRERKRERERKRARERESQSVAVL